jgi:Nucleoside 2-deoxyribosyltransferase like
MAKVFLGGTCNGSTWRDELIPMLCIEFFDPVVEDWNEVAYRRELDARRNCDFCLYVLTPRMTGGYAIAELVDDSNKRPQKTVFCYLAIYDDEAFDEKQLKSLQNVARMIEANGAVAFDSLEAVAEYLNRPGGAQPLA